jgi:hypothetical protein
MSEVLSKEIANLQLEVRNLQVQLQDKPAAMTKDLSVLPLISGWAGTSRSISVQEILDKLESVAVIGKWIGEDKILIATRN